jgi:hypothetical protein
MGLDHYHEGKAVFGVTEVLQYISTSSVECPVCKKPADPRGALQAFPVFGNPEALFGMQVWRGSKKLPQTSGHQVVIWDLGVELPYDGRIIYANITQMVSDPSGFESPALLIAQNSLHQGWPTHLRFHVPPGSEGRAISLLVVVKPTQPELDTPLEIALQAVDAFHRGLLGIACVSLAASIEASLRPRIEDVYKSRGVKLPADMGFASILERARLLLDPQPGPKLVGSLRDLANVGRNVTAHGGKANVTCEDVAGWMVDAAAVYEWARHAKVH